jgi:hypothetical protein
MTRLKNATFAGAPMVDVDVDAPTFQRVIANAIADTARAYDRATGSNGETGTMIHDGAGRGCLLGIPWCNQWIDGSLNLGSTTSGAAKHAGDGDTYLAVAPLFMPIGETAIEVWLQGTNLQPYNPAVEVYSTSGVLLTRKRLRNWGANRIRAKLTGLPAGESILVIRGTTSAIVTSTGPVIGHIHSASIHSGRRRSSEAGDAVPGRGDGSTIGVTDPGTAPVAWRDFDDLFTQQRFPLSSWLTSGLNRNQNGLFEYLTGWPASDNAAYVHVDSGTTNPSRSEFAAHARAGFAAEPLVEFPLMMSFLGAAKANGYFVVDAAEPPPDGMRDWYAPWPKTTATLPVDIAKQFARIPDFSPTDYDLHVSVLALQGPSFAGTWSIDVDVGAGNGVANFAAVGGGTNLLRAKTVLSTWSEDNANTINIGVSRTAGVRAVDEVAIVGYGLWFKPK